MAEKPYRTITIKSPNQDDVLQLAEKYGGRVTRASILDRRWLLTINCQTKIEYDDLVTKINAVRSAEIEGDGSCA
jgi:hypothetical protein